jgi:hypothetical protein
MSRVLVAQTVVLVAISLAILYPVVAYARTLLYTEAVTMLATSLLVFTAGSIVEEGLGMVTASEGIYLLSALCFAAATWLFAREFVRPGSGGFDVDDTASRASTGFDGAADVDAGDIDASKGGFSSAPQGVDSTTEGGDGE